MREALFVVISQSGRSPDLVTATEVARKSGALTLAIVNDEHSPAAAASELVLPIGAGAEHAVAATKTVVLSMIAGARLVAALARDDDLNDGLRHLPRGLSGALGCDWSAWADSAARCGGGVCRRPRIRARLRPRDRAEGLRNPAGAGPWLQRGRAAARPARLGHAGDARAGAAAERRGRRRRSTISSATCKAAGEQCLSPAARRSTLPWIGDGHPVCDPVAMLVPAYRAIEAAARRRGFDPDNPPYLSKVTRTL